MPILNRLAEMHGDITALRRDIHANPELGFEVTRTAALVAGKLREFGVDEVVEGIGRTGVVGVVHGRRAVSGRVTGLRADMDALPMTEATGLPHASTIAGRMHACGHDGHTAMLLGAAQYLAETRNFDGTAVLIFQPAEEKGGGGREMVEDGLMERFGIERVFGMHNRPGMPVGTFATRPGPLTAAVDDWDVRIKGLGGHAARPHQTVDPTVVAAHMVTALQSIVARNVDPIGSGVVSVTSFRTETDAHNIIPEAVHLRGTCRSLSSEIRDLLEARVKRVVRHTAETFGATAEIEYLRDYPVSVNSEREAEFAAEVAAEIAGPENVDGNTPPVLGAEDFSYMLEARPGAMIFLGNGETAGVHHPKYDFNDEAIPAGCSYWVRLVEKAMPLD